MIHIINSPPPQYILFPKILGESVANFQRLTTASGFTGSVLFWSSSTLCGDDDGSNPASGETYNPSSNPAYCFGMNPQVPFTSVQVNPDDTTANYYIQFYSDTGCQNQVWDDDDNGKGCFATDDSPMLSVYIDYD